MRKILFRAKTLKDVRWIYGDLVPSGTDPADGEYDIMYWDNESGWVQEHIDPKTIGQYTGYLDSMNVRIFEGDIVNVHLNECDMVGRFATRSSSNHTIAHLSATMKECASTNCCLSKTSNLMARVT